MAKPHPTHFERACHWVTFCVLLPLSAELFKRPRGGWLAFELQMIGHGLIGNGWRRV
jgi:hypothetical protein